VRGADSDLFLSFNLNDLAVVDDDFNGAVSNAFDGFKDDGIRVGARFMSMDVHVFYRCLRTPSLPHDDLLALVPIPEK